MNWRYISLCVVAMKGLNIIIIIIIINGFILCFFFVTYIARLINRTRFVIII